MPARIVILSDFLADTAALFSLLIQFVLREFGDFLLRIVDSDERRKTECSH